MNNAVFLGDHTALCRLKEGYKLFVDTRDRSLAPHILMDGIWEPWVRDFLLRQIKPKMTFVDIGANFGYYTILAGAAVGPQGRVHAFEPSPRLAQLLAWSIHINGILGWTTMWEKAVAAEAGRAVFRSATHYMGSSSLYMTEANAAAWRDTVQSHEVELCTLDQVLSGEQRIDIIKIDAEGAEPLIFKGAQSILAKHPGLSILFEFMPGAFPGGAAEGRALLGSLTQRGFSFYDVSTDSAGRRVDADTLLQRSWSEVYASRSTPR